MVLFRTFRNASLPDAGSMDYLLMIARQLQITLLIGDQIEPVLPNQKLLTLNEKVQVSLPLIPAWRTKRKIGL